ncbi:MAG: hypothetical protein GXY79_07055 [Chloroflexi bacterium]|nr:hypothetical protein [Chloroflexota bacterium]
MTHGWTIVDYYLRRKLAFHPARRAFDPLQVIPALDGDTVSIYGVNDGQSEWRGTLRYGLFTFDGSEGTRDELEVVLPPNVSTLLAQFPLADWQALGERRAAAYATLWENGICIRQNRLLLARFREVNWPAPEIRIVRRGERAVLSSARFVWGVCLDPVGDQELADDLFDLLPGIEWSIPWPTERPLPQVAYTGNGGAMS